LNSALFIIPLLLIISVPTAFAQVDLPEIDTTSEAPIPIDAELKYDFVDGLPIQVNTGNDVVLINPDCSVQINDYSNNVIFENDNYILRVSDYDSNNWADMEINGSSCNVFGYDNAVTLDYNFGFKTVQENHEGVLTKYYDISNPEKTKVSVEFENLFYPNHKFMTYEQITLADQNITFNDQEIDLSNFVGQSFDRNVLDNYTDVLIGFNNNTAFYQSEIGFDNLWSVDLIDYNKINLNYGKTDVLTEIGEKYILDPLVWGTSSSTQNPVLSFNSNNWSHSGSGSPTSSATVHDFSYGSHSGWNHSYSVLTGSDFNNEVSGDFTWVVRVYGMDTYQSNGGELRLTNGDRCYFGSSSGHSYLGTLNKYIGCNIGGTSNTSNPAQGTGYGVSDITISRSGNTYTFSGYGFTKTMSGTLDEVEFYEGRWTYAYSSSIKHETLSFNDPNYVPPSAPTAPQTLTTSQSVANQIVLNYLAPSSATPAVTNYKIYLDGSLIDTIGNVLTYTDNISGNEIGSGLTYSVIAVNSVGDSPASNNSFITAWDFPDAPISFQAVTGSPITMSYVTPNSDDTILNYKIYRDSVLIDTITPTNSYTDNTTVAGNSYVYSATALSAVGESSQSNTSTATAGIAPDAPSISLAINDVNATPLDIEISISHGSSMGTGTFSNFIIERSPDNSSWTTLSATPTSSPHTDTVPNSDTWYYRVSSQSNHGTSIPSAVDTITTPTQPSADSSVLLSIDNPNPNPLDVTVSFVAPNSDGGSLITGYNLSSSPDDVTYTQIKTGVTADQTITVANSGTWYFKSQPINNVGTAGLGTAVSITTPTIPGTITDLLATPISETQIDLTFSSPSNGGSNIVEYKIIRDGVQVATTPTPNYSDNTVVTQSSYTYSIITNNNVGDSANSNSQTVVTFGLPGIPVLTVSQNSITSLDLSWTIPQDYNSPIIGYKIEIDDGSGYVVETTNTGNINTSYTKTGLTPISEYFFRVSAINSYGTGLGTIDSNWTNPTTPTGLTVIPDNTSTNLELYWDSNISATGYKIERENGIGNGWSAVTNNTGNTNTAYQDTGLVDNIFYNYRISTVTPVGNSIPSSTFSQTTFHLPDPVTTLTATSGQFIDAELNWTQPSLYGYLEGYKIYTFDPITNITTTLISNTNSNNPSYSVTNLDPTITYHFKVSALTIHGENSSGNVANATATSENILGSINMPTDTNPTQIPIQFDQSFSGNNTIVKIKYAPELDVICDVDYKFARTTTTYSNLAETAELDGKVSHTMTFNNSDNDIVEMLCYDSTDNTIKGQHLLPMTTIPLSVQTDDFKNGIFGIDGKFGSLDLITLFVILIAMVGFNRYNPAVGVGIMTVVIMGMAWAGIIEPITVVGGILTMVFIIAVVLAKRRS